MTKKLFLTVALFAAAATMFVACGDKDDDNEPEVVDLGLPSGTLWAKTNLGAKNAWNFGDYYAWGETRPKADYSWETYKYCDGSDTTLTKYCHNAICGKNGFSDIAEGLTTLEPADDAATAVLGAGYSMPTEADWCELKSQCYWEWTWNYEGHNVAGYMVFKAKFDNEKGIVDNTDPDSLALNITNPHIFLPAAGWRSGLDFIESTPVPSGAPGFPAGHYWAGSIRILPILTGVDSFRIEMGAWPDKSVSVVDFPVNEWSIGEYLNTYCSRCAGCSVRPVKRP